MSENSQQANVLERDVQICTDKALLEGELIIPPGAEGVVIFAHGSGSSRYSLRNRYVARLLRTAGLGTLLFDLLTREEAAADAYAAHLRFDVDLLADRLVRTTEWLAAEISRPVVQSGGPLPSRFGYFGASTGCGAALRAAARLGDHIGAVVSRGGRPDLADAALPQVTAPTLLIVGGRDEPVIELNERAFERMRCKKGLHVIPGATHLFEEPGALDEVARLATEWFRDYLSAQPQVCTATGRRSGS